MRNVRELVQSKIVLPELSLSQTTTQHRLLNEDLTPQYRWAWRLYEELADPPLVNTRQVTRSVLSMKRNKC
jgi:hypothetical protein